MKGWRVNLIFILLLLFGAAIIGRLFYIQIVRHGYYKAMAQGQEDFFSTSLKERGEIFFRGGELLAGNAKRECIFAFPFEVENKEEVAKKLAGIFGSPMEKEIFDKLQEESRIEKLVDFVSTSDAKAVESLGIKGVYSEEGIFRDYPQKSVASQVIGFLGGEGAGQYGIEGYYDDILNPTYGMQEVDSESLKGADIFLTLDNNIQFTAENLLKKAKEAYNIKSGQIIVANPVNGKILALAGFPSFDPNNYKNEKDFDVFQNASIQKFFEPGSIFKPLTMAAAINEKAITKDTSYFDEGKVKIGPDTVLNYGSRNFGWQTMTQVLEKSINTGAVFAESKIDHNVFFDYLEKFGFFEPTGITLQSEVYSENAELKKGYEINYATASFGQGIEVTPLQMIKAFFAIANGGKIIRPTIIEKIVSNDSSYEESESTDNAVQVITPETALEVTKMMVSVVDNGPYTKEARIPGYYIAGKTGTAQISWSSLGISKRGYSDETWQSFIGFAPAYNPKFLILIKLDSPETKTAEYSAVPTFKELAKYIIDYLQIPPDYE